MLYHFLVAIGVIFASMVIWGIVQKLVRKNEGLSEDCDILEDRLGCKSCIRTDCTQYKP